MPPPRDRVERQRRSDNVKRRLMLDPTDDLIGQMLETVWYEGSSKHKLHPHLYGLEPFNGQRGDATLCDEADFEPARMPEVRALIQRGIRAGLIGHTCRILWTVADDGWIFEARETNRETAQFHGYPVLPEEAIARLVFDRFSEWAAAHGSPDDRSARDACKLRYGFP